MAARRLIIHDYRPNGRKARPSRRAPWFAAGAGIPLLAAAFMMPEARTGDAAPLPAGGEVMMTASAGGTQASSLLGPATLDLAPVTVSALRMPEPGAGRAGEFASISSGQELVMTVRRGDSLDLLFKRNKLDRGDLARLLQAEAARKHLRLIRPGDEITVRHDKGRIRELHREISLTESLRVLQDGDGFRAELVPLELETRQVRADGAIDSSLFLAGSAAGIPDRVIMNMVAIFAWDIDFVLDIRKGDSFTVLYEEKWRDGERLNSGDILAAEFVNRGRRFQAVRFEDPEGRVAYYTPEGDSMRKAFLRSPIAFARISSNFNPNRRHPVLNTIRAHKGVDYAAPTGTPIKAAGDGKVIFRGRKGGYGNTVILQHGGNITTLYAHMSRFNKNARAGRRVRQGDVIGYVGATGLATGAHLHYEYRRNGVHLNPRTVKLPDAAPINPAWLEEFRLNAGPLLAALESPRKLLASTPADAGN